MLSWEVGLEGRVSMVTSLAAVDDEAAYMGDDAFAGSNKGTQTVCSSSSSSLSD